MKFAACLTLLAISCIPERSYAAETNAAATHPASDSSAAATNRLGSFQVERGFRLELVASQPMVNSPVAMAFDENGRLFVVELPGGGRGGKTGAGLGRVRMLENMNEDGVFQNSTIYADNLARPSAVACYAGGIFVAAAPDILYLKDTKGDGIADARQVVISGLGGTNAPDPNALPNSFNWGVDNRIHAASARIGGELSSKGNPKGPVAIEASDFSFDPRTLEVFAEAGPAESGLTFDSYGREFVCDRVRPLMAPVYELRYFQRSPYVPRPAALAVVADPAAVLYPPASPPPQGGSARRATEGVGAAAGWKAACGCVVYRGRAFASKYFENVFVADPEAHVVHRMILREGNLAVTAERPPDEPAVEFLSSRDPSFRPAQIINGPDGALYVADRQDNPERGRIYRILPANFKRGKAPQLGKVKTYDLVGTLAQGDGWHRDTAQRLLYERNDPAAPALLRGTLYESHLAQARLLALHALEGAGALSERDVLRALRDTDEHVRKHGVLVAERLFKNGDASEEILAEFRGLLSDTSALVRYQLAFTLGELQRPDKAGALAQILGRDLSNTWVRSAVLSSAMDGAGGLFTILVGDARFSNDPAGMQFLEQLAAMIGVSGHQDAVTEAASTLGRASLAPAAVYALLYDLGDGLYRTRSSLGLVDTRGTLEPFYTGALNLAADPTQPEAVRAIATRLLGVTNYKLAAIIDWVLALCVPPTGPTLQLAAIDTLGRYDEAPVVTGLLDRWNFLAPVARDRAVSVLLSRDSHVAAVLDAVQSGRLATGDLSSTHRNFLRTYGVPTIRERALQLLGPVPVSRPELIKQFKPALELHGGADHGRVLFRQRCAGCHLPAGTATADTLGPDLLGTRTYSKDQVLSRILEPNLSVRPDYATSVVESKEGESIIGIVTDENSATVTLKEAQGGAVIWPQLNIRSVRRQSWSLMPEGLERGLSSQDMADLIEYVMSGAK